MIRLRPLLTGALLAGALSVGAAHAQAPAEPATEQTEAAAPGSMPDAFKAERLEELRYKHLWIAYGAIWLIVFVFVFRTWRSGEATAAELDGLKARLAKLEGRDGAQ